jgi:hypothetical protein
MGERHLERVGNELCAHVVGHRPADDAAAVEVLPGDQVEPALPGAQVGDVGTQTRFGASAANLRSTRSLATRTPAIPIVVPRDLRLGPAERPARRINRSTRVREICSPSSTTGSDPIRGEPTTGVAPRRGSPSGRPRARGT